MYLSELTITGFKSFAKKTELQFPAAVTAVVGPNGSGKSNVAEALRFVLGEQSVKSLRGKRGEDLIWGGSDELSRANRASVKVVIDNSQRVLALDIDDVTIERIVHRDGQNEYIINDSAVRLKDVHELLASGNIGPSGHHIISQGEADRVLSASPAERRSMIEEALGLKVYQYKKVEAERKLQKTQVNIAEVSALRKELAPHLQYLERELKKRSEAKLIRQKLEGAYAEYLKREDAYLADQFDRLTQARDELQAIITAGEAQIVELTNQLESESEKKVDDGGDALQVNLDTARKNCQALELERGQLLGKRDMLAEQISAFSTPTKEVVLEKSELDKHVESFERVVEKVLTLDSVELIRDKILSAFTAFKQAITDTDAAVDTSRIEQLTAQKEEVEVAISEVSNQISTAETAEREAQTALATYRTELSQLQSSQQEATKQLYEEKVVQSERRAKLQNITHELEIVERERTAFKSELQEAVTLLGRDAAQYFTHTVTDEAGENVSTEHILAEPREQQRQRQRELEKLKIRLETLGVGESETLEKEYETTKERDDFLAREITDLETSVASLQALIVDLESQIHDEFKLGFTKIEQEFSSFFKLMFGGGTASLKLEALASNADDEEEESEKTAPQYGVDLDVKLPNKRIQGLAMLSGGERALTSIALVFAMSQVHPPLFIVLDETDAALDEANSRRYGDLIETLAQRSQLILITHNRETMSRAGVLYGVTMTSNGMSKVLSVQLEDAVTNAK